MSRLGRFELRKVLGKGAQATVWLASDTRLEREVALKRLDTESQAVNVQEWLHEARAVSRLTHPNIVTLFEADEIEGQPCLVFEFVDGPTLAQRLRDSGALPASQAVPLMLGILDALDVAHRQGIVHRDLKPSNVLVGPDGRARVMDFGIAARVASGGDGRIVGTPGYISPEAARAEAPSARMDVFAAGVMLAEMLSGQPLLRERDPYRAVQRVQTETLALPADCEVEDGLRAIVNRALDRDPALRYADAAAMRQALASWTGAQAAPVGAEGGGTLEFLLRRMRHRSDFPAMSTAVARIQKLATSEKESVHSLADEILKDVALTKKLLRLVNSAHFSQAGSGGVSTVSRAIMLVGLSGIRNMALSLILLEHMGNKAHAQQLREEFVRSLMAGHLASELSVVAADAEEAFIGALFQNLGRLLTEFYFPEEATQIRTLVAAAASDASGQTAGMDEQAASRRVLGLSFEELGAGVAQSWGMPETLRHIMRRPAGAPPGQPLPRGPERSRWVVAVANEVADTLLASEPADAARKVEAVSARHARALGWKEPALRQAVQESRTKLATAVSAMGIDLPAAAKARRLLVAAPQAAEKDTVYGLELQPTRSIVSPAAESSDAPTLVLAPQDGGRPQEDAAQLLSAGIQDITNSLVDESVSLSQVLHMVLETMYRALGFRRVIFCLRDPRLEALTGRLGIGDQAQDLAKVFRVSLAVAAGAKPDLFTAICLRGADTLISDVDAGSIAARLPGWFKERVGAPTFLLLPVMMKGAPIALIYADCARAGDIALDERELNLLRTLRNQAVMAFRQASG